ncbi:RILP-like protein 2 isoform X1 [Salmo salar]|uniref:RILP-like protein 2 n=1 Tax=Salmo salar TaxID=8030 RepID=A0A1S3PGM8_SALSA|nr:RILP-like protein 2 isoform X1 [Salmo salar]|eukprot:XP_014026800.1 PREDICTED: RILP-like protein 2 isoform X1 [Salmo salar]
MLNVITVDLRNRSHRLRKQTRVSFNSIRCVFGTREMEELNESTSSPASAFEKDAFELTVEDVYDISYVIGRDLLKIINTGEEVSDLQFKIVRVLEMFETLVNKHNLSLEELKMERDNLKSELDRIVRESSVGKEEQTLGPNKLVVDMKDPNRPRFTMQELKEVLQERNQLKAQLLVAQEELQLYKSGVHSQGKQAMVKADLEFPSPSVPDTTDETKEEEPKEVFIQAEMRTTGVRT